MDGIAVLDEMVRRRVSQLNHLAGAKGPDVTTSDLAQYEPITPLWLQRWYDKVDYEQFIKKADCAGD